MNFDFTYLSLGAGPFLSKSSWLLREASLPMHCLEKVPAPSF